MYRSFLFAALPLCLALTACSPAESHNDEEKPRPAVMVRPQIASAQQDVFPGEIHARYESALAFRIGGKISRRLVEVGDRVARDQPLAELSAEDLQLQLDSARARLHSAEAEQRLARSELERYRKLRERQLVSSSQFDTAQTRFDASSAQLKQARAQLAVARNQADYAVLKAPQAGVIAQRQAEAGQVVAAGQAVFALAADGEREVRIDLPEQGIGRFAVGQELALELWSQPGQLFPARLRELSPAADPASRTFEARVAFDNKVVGAELGQSARVFVNTGASAQLLAVPMSAVTADGGQPFVWVLDPLRQTLHKTPITVGPYGEEQVPVLTGLQPDDWIVAAGTHLLRDGQAVRPVDRMNRPIDLDRSLAHQE
ncbi:membrane fusion protein, multidrug efflux system [Microbulbifer donghaiensis]|uniref:Membrane fusion protein, multidrug efflux system n=1 Tax=Microbulbifer donghaiensis TaxID=494016 RepID=A0A1M4Z0Q0_9GAMM|nr:efflux RND transporter periplasmic adaptor subunit [Microbulbifer donghaiensis]SHF11631.1 membrane fusion protein, multidrug efflux system [Microbulbifer donghaiensis]